jgi:hypothetical protein
MTFGDALKKIIDEIERAKALHPFWPSDLIHATAIIGEESGEAIRAALNHVYADAPIDEVEKEIIQTVATCFRALMNWKGK